MGEVVLGLDVGQARIGVARGETGSRLAFPAGVLTRGRQADDVRAVSHMAEELGAVRIVVGLPRRTDGRDSKQTQRVRAFTDALRAAGLNAEYADERFTTAVAERRLASSSLPAAKRRDKGRVDEAAAVLILETWLAAHADAAPPP